MNEGTLSVKLDTEGLSELRRYQHLKNARYRVEDGDGLSVEQLEYKLNYWHREGWSLVSMKDNRIILEYTKV